MAQGRVGLETKQAAAARERLTRKEEDRGVQRVKVGEEAGRIVRPVAVASVIIADRAGAAELGSVDVAEAALAGGRRKGVLGKTFFAAEGVLADIHDGVHAPCLK